VFSQCTVCLNGTTITQATELYNYSSLLVSHLTYGIDAATILLTNALWVLDNGNMATCYPTATDSTNRGFMTRRSLTKQSQEIELYGQIPTYFCNVPVYLLPVVKVKDKIHKGQVEFLHNEKRCRIENCLPVSWWSTMGQAYLTEPYNSTRS
jgi:hypothetical protein